MGRWLRRREEKRSWGRPTASKGSLVGGGGGGPPCTLELVGLLLGFSSFAAGWKRREEGKLGMAAAAVASPPLPPPPPSQLGWMELEEDWGWGGEWDGGGRGGKNPSLLLLFSFPCPREPRRPL